uniref:Uncharacterized protein n=1 Tax=Oryza sativa subsp. japonica TaxID=39947 RepID=Q5VNP7_ORYSJ|nr:hypothetical protein [Oryza sativa Japonica Group]
MALLPAEVDGEDRGWLCAMDTYASCCVPLPSKEVDAVKKRGIRRATEMERKASRPVAGEEAAGDRQERGRATLRRRRWRQPDEEKEAAKDGETRWQPDAGEILVVDIEVTEGLDDGDEVDGNGGVLANGVGEEERSSVERPRRGARRPRAHRRGRRKSSASTRETSRSFLPWITPDTPRHRRHLILPSRRADLSRVGLKGVDGEARASWAAGRRGHRRGEAGEEEDGAVMAGCGEAWWQPGRGGDRRRREMAEGEGEGWREFVIVVAGEPLHAVGRKADGDLVAAAALP